MTSEAKYFTVKEYAELMRVTEETVRRWLRSGQLEATRTRQPLGHWRIPTPRVVISSSLASTTTR